MKRRGKLVIGMVVLGIIAGVFFWLTSNPALRALEAARKSLRREGFKLELSEFDFSIPDDVRRRASLLARTTLREVTNHVQPGTGPWPRSGGRGYELLVPIGTNAAVVLWQSGDLRDMRVDAMWAKATDMLRTNAFDLKSARAAAISGPIRFEPIGRQRTAAMLPYLGDMRSLANQFSEQTLLALRDGQRGEAWSNLLAVTCLATSYEPEPIEVSHFSWFGWVRTAFDTTWNALQAPGWSDVQLADLQRRWEAVQFWTNLPATAAYARADAAALYEAQRQEDIPRRTPFHRMLQHPGDAWAELSARWNDLRFRHQGSYEEEKDALLYYRDRELELRRAIEATNWLTMRDLPGATNAPPFVSRPGSRSGALMNLRQMNAGFQRRGVGFLGRAAETEARRRLIVTALALERYHGRHGNYPANLSELAPEFLRVVPVDFMDGQPLRYLQTPDGHFVLYSIGTDEVDNGGRIRPPGVVAPPPNGFFTTFGMTDDLVWPRPASAEEIERQQIAQTRAAQAAMANAAAREERDYWRLSDSRLKHAAQVLAEPPKPPPHEPMHAGRAVSELLRNTSVTNQTSLFELLTLKQVITGGEPEKATFELPIKYDALLGLGELFLCVDGPGEESELGWQAGNFNCTRTANGNCRITWGTIYEPPGTHAIFMGFALHNDSPTNEACFGPAISFVVTNLCQFTPESANFTPQTGANFYARLPESNGTYKVELKSLNGELVRTFAGSTTNRFFQVRWDLTDETGRRCTNNEYNSFFHLTLPDSGRSQTLRGP